LKKRTGLVFSGGEGEELEERVRNIFFDSPGEVRKNQMQSDLKHTGSGGENRLWCRAGSNDNWARRSLSKRDGKLFLATGNKGRKGTE